MFKCMYYKTLVYISIFVQLVAFKTNIDESYEFPFITLLKTPEVPTDNITAVLYSIIPIPFIVISFSAKMKEQIHGYGTLLIIRNYSKTKLVMRLIYKIIKELSIIMVVTFLVYELTDNTNEITIKLKIIMMIFYFLVIFKILLIEMFMELFIESSSASVIAIIIYTSEILLSNTLTAGGKNMWLNCLMSCNLAFANKNGLIEEEYTNMCVELAGMIILTKLMILMCIIIIAVRKKDLI